MLTRRSLIATPALVQGRSDAVLVPTLAGEWWTVAHNPDLGQYTTPQQEPVDFAVWRAVDGTWQLWSCIRKTSVPGATRLFYRWQGNHLNDSNWTPMGIALMADPNLGEREGALQAPFVLRIDGVYHMFYSSGGRFALAKSRDGKTFARDINPDGKVGLFGTPGEGAGWGGRDIMVIRVRRLWHAYYTASSGDSGRDYVRTSTDLRTWSHPREVAFGGAAGSNAWSAECPFVFRLPGSPWYYLFRTRQYKPGAQETFVYRSKDPFDFGLDDDRYLVSTLAIAAPELVEHEGRLYLAALKDDLKGIRIAPLEFRPKNR